MSTSLRLSKENRERGPVDLPQPTAREQADAVAAGRWQRLLARVHHLAPVLVIVLFALAIWLLQHELSQYRFQDIRHSLANIPRYKIFLALLLTTISYTLLTGYDALALNYLDRALPYRRVALASFLGYVLSHNVGLSILGATAPRYRLYSSSDLSTGEVAKVITFTSLTFWLGWLTLAGGALLLQPHIVGVPLPRFVGRGFGIALLALVVGYVVWTAVQHRPLTWGNWSVELPSTRTAAIQVVLSVLDWLVAAGVLFVLLPATAHISYVAFLPVFLFALMAGLVSHVPGGLGVFETIVVMALGDAVAGHQVLGALLAYRAIYYLLPLFLAAALFAAHELSHGRQRFPALAAIFDRWLPNVVPGFLAIATFLSGLALLISGATPAAAGRLALLERFLPLPILEVSHFVGSLTGVALILLANGLQRRLDVAYLLSVALLVLGIVVSLLKGFDYEEAMVLSLVLAALLPARHRFYRRASLLQESFTPGWIVAIAIAITGTTWLVLFAFKHVEYSRQLWWQFALDEEAPRALRASVGVLTLATAFALARMLRPGGPLVTVPDAAALVRVRAILAASPRGYANLSLLGDKQFLFSESGRSFLMYGVEGKSWVAMGDPVGPEEEHGELIWRFREECDRHDAWAVFYEVGTRNLPLFLDVGLSPFKFGEEARVRLAEFNLEGPGRKDMRYVIRRAERDGSSFQLIARDQVPETLERLREISEAWCAQRATREKAFSLGAFSATYLCEFPLGVVYFEGRIVAFANLWCAAEREEIAPDLMRYGPDAPADTMEYLFLKLMLWAKQEDYRWFNLGMAPLAGMEGHALAPLWQRIGAFVFEHGSPFYNFEGLRRYKNKFDPQWEPKYLVVPSGIVLPRVLINIASLVSGGLGGAVTK